MYWSITMSKGHNRIFNLCLKNGYWNPFSKGWNSQRDLSLSFTILIKFELTNKNFRPQLLYNSCIMTFVMKIFLFHLYVMDN